MFPTLQIKILENHKRVSDDRNSFSKKGEDVIIRTNVYTVRSRLQPSYRQTKHVLQINFVSIDKKLTTHIDENMMLSSQTDVSDFINGDPGVVFFKQLVTRSRVQGSEETSIQTVTLIMERLLTFTIR